MTQARPSGCLVALFKLFGAAPAKADAPEALPYRRELGLDLGLARMAGRLGTGTGINNPLSCRRGI